MKQIQFLIIILSICVSLASCEGRTGFYDTGQEETINLLTGAE